MSYIRQICAIFIEVQDFGTEGPHSFFSHAKRQASNFCQALYIINELSRLAHPRQVSFGSHVLYWSLEARIVELYHTVRSCGANLSTSLVRSSGLKWRSNKGADIASALLKEMSNTRTNEGIAEWSSRVVSRNSQRTHGEAESRFQWWQTALANT